ncbi:GNAT family N-acetyltransferase [Carboxylicivirga mesophila]|uniref:GNAT family N-acetyltransferase n=1 Tax=Carboxylicivirga mesophila TaxID=1166478 RepID=A0ABS5KEX0_9BACT|nr:GNAT family N-acetyltransferase [Carboxylicivirga mesophila]MBS2213599.1 GNAT family N-acetyltransferase [Carboxylicivirga mesophila]
MILFETPRLIARHITQADIYELLPIYNKEANMRYISSGKHQWTHTELTNKYRQVNQNYHLGIGIFALILKSDDSVIGEAGLFNSFDNLQRLEMGYIIDSSHWEKGLGKEVCCGLIQYAFQTLNTQTLIARMYTDNKASVALSEKCGMAKTESGHTDDGKEYLVFSINNTCPLNPEL